TAYLLARNKVVGWFQGRMESGPRAIGNRSDERRVPCEPEHHQRESQIPGGVRALLPVTAYIECAPQYLVKYRPEPFTITSFDATVARRTAFRRSCIRTARPGLRR